MVHRCMIKSVVVWLHILVVSLLMCLCHTVWQQSTAEQCDMHTNMCSHITTELIIHQCTIIDYFNKV